MKKLAALLLLCVTANCTAHDWEFDDLGVYYSRTHEDLPSFMKRLGRVVQDYTDATGHEVCGMLSQKSDQFAIRLSSDGVQLGCSLDKQETVEGFEHTGVYVHSHPSGKNDGGQRILRVSERDRAWVKWRGERPQWHRILYITPGFSPDDIRFGNGWLIERGRVYSHTKGRRTEHGPIAATY